MLISELSPDTAVTIKVITPNETIEFHTAVAEIEDKHIEKAIKTLQKKISTPSIIVDAIRNSNGKLLGFEGLKFKITVSSSKDNKPYLWSVNVAIRTIHLDNGIVYHMILASQNADSYNLRGSYRLWLGLDGSIQVGENTAAYGVIVKDLSTTGIGLIISTRHQLKIGDLLKVKFTDESTGTVFKLAAILIREQEIAEDKKLLGCKLNTTNPYISKFINEKQRERIKVGGRTNYLKNKIADKEIDITSVLGKEGTINQEDKLKQLEEFRGKRRFEYN